jgi:hypothetical protein
MAQRRPRVRSSAAARVAARTNDAKGPRQGARGLWICRRSLDASLSARDVVAPRGEDAVMAVVGRLYRAGLPVKRPRGASPTFWSASISSCHDAAGSPTTDRSARARARQADHIAETAGRAHRRRAHVDLYREPREVAVSLEWQGRRRAPLEDRLSDAARPPRDAICRRQEGRATGPRAANWRARRNQNMGRTMAAPTD